MRIIPIKSINDRTGAPADFAALSEKEYCMGITDAALGIIEANKTGGKPIVLITGPSGSGKTVTAHRLKAELTKQSMKTHIISMDNYFKPLKCGTDGVDLESPDRVDRGLFAEQAEKILNGEQVTLPVFDFTKQDRHKGAEFKREKSELVIFEGIHMLNPDISGCLAGHESSVYVSVRTRLKSTLGHSLHPSKIRLMRRFVRDKLFRARSFYQTMEHFNNVQRGEKKHIMPYKKHADFDIDTFVPYEMSIYKKHIFPELKAALEKNNFIYELLMFLDELEDIGDEFVPEDSLIREFIGGNTLMY
ncbi:MAG: nucleoside kinase [Oscillospiraceae bacterium]|jgi:uridine kinase|nr:nucleoside kinase [Oscillospiraceae bacterium]